MFWGACSGLPWFWIASDIKEARFEHLHRFVSKIICRGIAAELARTTDIGVNFGRLCLRLWRWLI